MHARRHVRTYPVDGGEGAGVVGEEEVGRHELRGAGRLHPQAPRLLLVVRDGVQRRLLMWVRVSVCKCARTGW